MSPLQRESEMLSQRLDALRREIDKDSASLRTRWSTSPVSSGMIFKGLLAVGGALFAVRGANLVRRVGIKPLVAAAVVKFALRALAKRRR
jgi:hypothetical protein